MDLGLAGKTAVVTGASRGIGLAATRALTAAGVRVVGGSRTITAELKETGAIPVPVDLSTPEGAGELLEAALEELGGIDVLVNNVGGGDAAGMPMDGYLSVSDEVWQRTFDVNFFSAVRVTRAALPSLLERSGSVVNVSSIGARMPGAGPVFYNAAKGALTNLATSLSEEFAPQGVRVNTVSPGPVGTAMWRSPEGFASKLAERAGVELEEFLTSVPSVMGLATGRLVEPEEVADLIAYLASPRAASITGADYLIDAGAVKTA